MCIMAVYAEQAISIVREMNSVEIVEPEPALFQVETSLKSGRPPKWTLNGEVLEPCAAVNISREGTLHSLCLAYTESSMSGTVVFVAGKSRSTAQLNVKGVCPSEWVSMLHIIMGTKLEVNICLRAG